MLTADLVRARRRGDRIVLQPLREKERTHLLEVAAAYIEIITENVGETRATLRQCLDAYPTMPTAHKQVAGLRKLLFDRCDFSAADGVDAPALRRCVFAAAARQWAALDGSATFNRDDALTLGARPHGLTACEANTYLFADLKDNHRLQAFTTVAADALVRLYELAQAQALLLRATSVRIHLRAQNAQNYRFFLQRLKFHRLLFTLQRHDDGGYVVDLSGPYSLFQSVTKYGLQLALMLPILRSCGAWELNAEVLWGKARTPLRFDLRGVDEGAALPPQPALVADAAELMQRFAALDTPWTVQPAGAILHLPGFGPCVPDLVFDHPRSGARVFLEVMGYWSRAAVWQRVELVLGGLTTPILFALSSRLRVDEKVLDTDLPGELYVYRGTIRAAEIAKRLTRFTSTPTPAR